MSTMAFTVLISILFGRDKAGIVSYQKNGVERIASQVAVPANGFAKDCVVCGAITGSGSCRSATGTPSLQSVAVMESQMYPSVAKIEQFLKEHPEKPFICCEYSHSMGNSNGALFKYTDLAKREPRYQGGFIWDFIDQAVFKKNEYGESFLEQAAILTTVRQTTISARMALSLQTAPLPQKWQK